jgi:hypothetical protein
MWKTYHLMTENYYKSGIHTHNTENKYEEYAENPI